jgi:hypothetical protein
MDTLRAPSVSVWGAAMVQVLPRLKRPASALLWPVDDINASSAGYLMQGSLTGHGAETLAPYLEQVLFQPRCCPMTW